MTRAIFFYGGLVVAVIALIALLGGCAREPSGRTLTNALIFDQAQRAHK